MRRTPVALAFVAVALTAAACGSSGKSANSSTDSSSATGTQASSSGSGDAAGILSSIDRSAATGPQKLKLDLTVDIKGSPSNAQLAIFTKQPIHLGLDGVIDSAGKSGDINVSVTLGKTPINAEFRYGGGKSWIQIDGKWYDLPADALSSTTGTALPSGASASNLDAGKVLAAIGDPSTMFENTSVSSEKVEGIDSDKVSGDINIAAVAKAAAKLSAASTGTTTAQPSVDSGVAQLEKIVKKAHVDLWVGKSDHKVHRAVISGDATMDAATKTSSGIDSLTLNLDVTSVDASKPDVLAPSSVGTAQEFQTALVGLLTKVMGGAAAG